MTTLININHFLFLKQILTGPLITFRTVTLSYKILGDATTEPPKPPIFIFHGLIGNKVQWEGIGKTLLNLTRRTVVAVDLRNHGDSPHTTSHKYTDQARDVLKLMEKLGAQQASLIGHCVGGRTAMCVALMAPKAVPGLVVVDVSPVSTPRPFKDSMLHQLKAIKAIDLQKFKMVSLAKTEARRQLKQIVTEEYVMKIILSNIRTKPDSSIGWICNLDVLIKDHKYWLSFPKKLQRKTYDGPTLFIGGQFSDFIPPDDLIGIRALFPLAVITYIPKTGHFLQVDDPKTFLELTIASLKTHTYTVKKK